MADYLGNYTGPQIDSILNDSDQNTYRKSEVDDIIKDFIGGVKLVEITPADPTTTAKSYKMQVKNASGSFVDVVGATIDIPKDKFITSGQIKTAPAANNPITGLAMGDPYLEFTVDGSTTPLYVSVASIAGSKAAADITFNPAGTDLTGTTVQAALAEVAAAAKASNVNVATGSSISKDPVTGAIDVALAPGGSLKKESDGSIGAVLASATDIDDLFA